MSTLNVVTAGMTKDDLPRLEVAVPTTVYPLEAIKIACFSLHQEMRAEVLSENDGVALVELVPFAWKVTTETAVRLFRRELLVAAVNRQARLDDVEVQKLFAGSAFSITTQRMVWLEEVHGELAVASSEESPNTEQLEGGAAPAEQVTSVEGYSYVVNHAQSTARIRVDARRYVLPVLLSAAKELCGQAKVLEPIRKRLLPGK